MYMYMYIQVYMHAHVHAQSTVPVLKAGHLSTCPIHFVFVCLGVVCWVQVSAGSSLPPQLHVHVP